VNLLGQSFYLFISLIFSSVWIDHGRFPRPTDIYIMMRPSMFRPRLPRWPAWSGRLFGWPMLFPHSCLVIEIRITVTNDQLKLTRSSWYHLDKRLALNMAYVGVNPELDETINRSVSPHFGSSVFSLVHSHCSTHCSHIQSISPFL
jgi:hypothetical protein